MVWSRIGAGCLTTSKTSNHLRGILRNNIGFFRYYTSRNTQWATCFFILNVSGRFCCAESRGPQRQRTSRDNSIGWRGETKGAILLVWEYVILRLPKPSSSLDYPCWLQHGWWMVWYSTKWSAFPNAQSRPLTENTRGRLTDRKNIVSNR